MGGYRGKWDGGSGGSGGLSVWLCPPWVCGSWDKGAGRTASAAELGWVDQSGGGRLPGPSFTTLAKRRTMRMWRSRSSSAGGPLHSWERTSGLHNWDSETIGCWEQCVQAKKEYLTERRQRHSVLVAIQTFCPVWTLQPLLISVVVDDEVCEHTVGVVRDLWICCYDMQSC